MERGRPGARPLTCDLGEVKSNDSEDNEMIRRNQDQLLKGTKPEANSVKGTSEERLRSKLQKESLKLHGDLLDRKKTPTGKEK